MGDVALAIRQLTERLPKEAGRPAPPPLEELPTPEAEGSLPADYVLHTLAQHLPDRAILVEETPSSRALLHKHVRIKSPGGFYAAASEDGPARPPRGVRRRRPPDVRPAERGPLRVEVQDGPAPGRPGVDIVCVVGDRKLQLMPGAHTS